MSNDSRGTATAGVQAEPHELRAEGKAVPAIHPDDREWIDPKAMAAMADRYPHLRKTPTPEA